MRYPTLGEVYDRRTQFIHSRLVPQKVQERALTFNMRLLDSKKTFWPAKGKAEEEFVQSFHCDSWQDCLAQLGDAWEFLYTWLKDNFVEQEQPPFNFEPIPVVTVPEIKIPDGPVPPSNIQCDPGWFQLPPSG